MAKVSAIVLAAGLSRRMGAENKMGLPFKGKPMVHHVVDQLAESEAFETIIVTSEVSQGLFPDQEIILNEHYQTGMTSSIQVGIKAASTHADGYMICLGDLPLITTADYNKIIRSFEENLKKDAQTIVLPTFDGKNGNPVVFSTEYKEVLLNHPHPEGCKAIVQANQEHLIFQALDTAAILQDVDRPEDYEGLINDSYPN